MDACHFICLVLIQKLAWVDGRLDETEAHDPTGCVPRWKDAVIGYRKKTAAAVFFSSVKSLVMYTLTKLLRYVLDHTFLLDSCTSLE